ncbi:MAG: hypothetical protein NTZ48_00185, partial [Candidatus Omnitrophica bacterium]|nr:hypothetical protein [Candidatus Omnitrophota bacterium]
FTFTPALRSFIERCSGLANKKAAVFLTCGSAMTSGGALKELRNFLTRKGADVKFTAYVKGVNTGNREYLENKFKRLSVYLV